MRWSEIETTPCPVARTLSVIGDRWTMLILRDAFRHPVRFQRLSEKFGMARHLLSSRLDRLVEQEVLERVPYQARPERHEYRLTAKGRSLFPILLSMMQWGERWMVGVDEPHVVLRHTACGASFSPAPVCPACGEPVTAETVTSLLR